MESALRRLVWALTETPRSTLLRHVAVGAGIALGASLLVSRLRKVSSARTAEDKDLAACPAHYRARLEHAFAAAKQHADVLAPLAAQPHLVHDAGTPFIVSVLDPHRLKQKQANGGGKASSKGGSAKSGADAFERIPRAALVGSIAGTHSVLLNKFFITPKHLVITTKTFEPQHHPLSQGDMLALYATVKRLRGLGFFNCGEKSGASQPRRHTQFLPFCALRESLPPAAAAAVSRKGHLPIDAVIGAARAGAAQGAAPGQPFRLDAGAFPVPHAVCVLGGDLHTSPLEVAAAKLKAWYHDLLAAAGVHNATGGASRVGDHNLLLTPTWMMVVSRQGGAAEVRGVSVNALGFAGLLLVKPGEAGSGKSAAEPGSLLPLPPTELLRQACCSA